MSLQQVYGQNVPQVNLPEGMFDLDKIIPISLIRDHTKTADIPSVSDSMLMLYRSAAMQAAEKYTGMILVSRKVMIEEVPIPPYIPHKPQPFFVYSAKYSFSHPIAYYYGYKDASPQTIGVTLGQNRVQLPNPGDQFGFGCCNPCATKNSGRLMYTTGYICEDNIPSGIILGALKYIAHVLENAGDEARAVSESGGRATGMKIGEPNNPALASGAIEIWRLVKDDAI